MKGLIKKDLLLLKYNFRVVLILFLVYGFMTITGDFDFTLLLPFTSVMLMISTFSYDSYNKWDSYSVTLPRGRENSVLAKYLSTILIIFIESIIIFVVDILIYYYRTKLIEFDIIFSSLLGSIVACFLILSFMFPCIYKFGVEKARMGIFVVVFGIIIIGGIISKVVDLEVLSRTLNSFNDYTICIILVTLMVIITSISFIISKHIFNNKEF